MKVTYNWLKDFVDIRISAKKLAHKLTMAGLEVTSLEEKDSDFVFELEITSNRPDWLSVIGIAREVAAITGKKLKLVHSSQFTVHSQRKNKKRHGLSTMDYGQLSIKIENKKDCPLYTARIIKGIEVKPSPDWLKKRLELVGLRSVNNIVDITNYVLMETGQPLHAFDFDLDKLVIQLSGYPVNRLGIIVRRARRGEEITTIDGIKRILNENILIIASNIVEKTGKLANRQTRKPIAIAGIMGGQDSEVNNNTRDILLEAAVFDPITTRRASKILGLSSESSYRFERGVDWQSVELFSMRAANLILRLAGGKLIESEASPKPEVKKTIISLKGDEVSRILGVKYSSEQIKKLLASLSFSVKQRGRNLRVEAPSFRADVSQPADLIEEIARISGYENIPTRLPKIIPQHDAGIVSSWYRIREVKDILISQGVNEIITYSLISRSLVYELGYSDSQLIVIANPLTSQQETLRPSLIFGLISAIGYNLNQKQSCIRIFEICNSFKENRERLSLGLACCGEKFTLLHIKGMLELLLRRLGIANFEFITGCCEHTFFQKKESLSLMLNAKICADLGMVKPEILEKFEIEDFVFAAEVDLATIFSGIKKTQKRYVRLPLFPEVVRDISIVLKQEMPIGEVIKRIKTGNIPYLAELNFKEYYLGKQIPAGHKGVTLSCVYRADDHTLTSEEAEIAHQKALDILKTDFSARQR